MASWTVYNTVAIGSPYTDPRAVGFLNRFLFGTPGFVAIILAGGLAVDFALYVSQAALPYLLLRDGREAATDLWSCVVRDEKIAALILFVLVAILISALMSAAFLLYDPFRSLATADTYLRYADVVAPMTYLAVAIHMRSAARHAPRTRLAVPFVIALLVLAPQFAGKVSQGQANSGPFAEIADFVRTRGFEVVHSDVARFLRYNVPAVTFIEVDVGTSLQSVNLTAYDVPSGASLLTLLLVPRTYDERIGAFYLIDHFDPSVNSPFLNLFYGV